MPTRGRRGVAAVPRALTHAPAALLAFAIALAAPRPAAAMPFTAAHYADNMPAPGRDYYGASIAGPLMAGPTIGYYPYSTFNPPFAESPGTWSGEFVCARRARDAHSLPPSLPRAHH